MRREWRRGEENSEDGEGRMEDEEEGRMEVSQFHSEQMCVDN